MSVLCPLLPGEDKVENLLMSERIASCCCGVLQVICLDDPLRVSICHCLDCQKRTGSVFSTNARFAKEAVRVDSPSKSYSRRGDSGSDVTFHFCPDCGSTVWWQLSGFLDVIAVAVGAFADSQFPRPRFSVYENRHHHWVPVSDIPGLEHMG